MSTETKEDKVTRDPKVYKAILGIRAEIKERAAKQKTRRLKKLQKSPYDRAEITALHRLYLRLRGKDEEAHHLPPNDSYLYTVAKRYEQSVIARYELEEPSV